jgi:hypothetical protein
VTDTTHTEDTVNLFAEYGEVRLSEDEFGRFVAHGHVTAEDMTAGMRAYTAEVGGVPMEKGLVPVEHVWAVIKHEDGAADDDGWYFTWDDVSEATPGAFPLTVVPSL